MGERLAIVVKDQKGDNLATAYYHWSGFTVCAFATILRFNRAKLPDLTFEDGEVTLLKDAVYRLTATGAGFTKKVAILKNDSCGYEEIDNPVFKTYNAPTCLDRNDGILNIDDHGMQETIKWAEHTIYVTLNDDHTLQYDLHDALWEVDDDREQWYDQGHKFLDIPIFGYDIHKLSEKQLEELITVLTAVHPEQYDHDVSYAYLFEDGSLLQFVE